MGFAIRRATSVDLGWINANSEGWTVAEHGGKWGVPHALDKAWAVLVADDGHGARLGWMYVVNMHDHLTLHLLYVDPQHRYRGVARALVEHLFASYRGKILLGSWNRELAEAWKSLGFAYKPTEGDRPPHGLYGDMVRSAGDTIPGGAETSGSA